ncbi:tetratricopeptide repeat protein [Nocardia sp. NPDC051570]|uniref:tetratricopeptide repeat protein n=1 Tax=Nocardia sp. NPDC051570 TaxID=3364324 RepID=UPI0037AADB57
MAISTRPDPCARHYRIRVRGRLGETLRCAFPALEAEAVGGDTVLTGVLADQAALYGVLAELEALGLQLIEIRPIPPRTPHPVPPEPAATALPMETFDPFRLWLHQPLANLGEMPTAPTFLVHAVELDYRSMVESAPRPRIQVSINHSFRGALATAIGRPEFDIRMSGELPEAFRSERWSILCDFVDSWDGLSPERRVRVCWTLAKLGLFDEILRLVPDIPVSTVGSSEESAAFAYLRAWARFKKWLDGEEDGFSADEFAAVASSAPAGMTRIDAAYEMVRQHAKYTGDVAECELWQVVHRAAIDAATGLDDHTRTLMLSRYHRVDAFIPQFRRDAAAVDAAMTRAENLARSAARDDPDQAVAADEMLYAALESRIKEALWTRDTGLALERANEYVALSPSSARGYWHRAEVLFRVGDWTRCRRDCLEAARLAPPHADEALFLLGQCYEQEESPDEAINAYLGTLRADPLAISAVERLTELTRIHRRAALRDWVTGYADHLLSQEPPEQWAAAYRDLPAPAPTA